MRLIPLIMLVQAACAFQRPAMMKPPTGLNDYAQMQDYLDCHGSWRERACFTERGYTEIKASPPLYAHRASAVFNRTFSAMMCPGHGADTEFSEERVSETSSACDYQCHRG